MMHSAWISRSLLYETQEGMSDIKLKPSLVRIFHFRNLPRKTHTGQTFSVVLVFSCTGYTL